MQILRSFTTALIGGGEWIEWNYILLFLGLDVDGIRVLGVDQWRMKSPNISWSTLRADHGQDLYWKIWRSSTLTMTKLWLKHLDNNMCISGIPRMKHHHFGNLVLFGKRLDRSLITTFYSSEKR